MRFFLASFALQICTVSAAPISVGAMEKRHPQGTPYQCPDGGAYKASLKNAKATPHDLSIQQQEGTCDGASYPAGDNKSGLAYNAGPFKNNWDNISKYCCPLDSRLCGGPNDGYKADFLMQDHDLAVRCQHAQEDSMGEDRFDCTQRGGSSCTPKDTSDYKNAISNIENTGVNGDPNTPITGVTGDTPVASNTPSTVVTPKPSDLPITSTGSTTTPNNPNQGGTDIYGSDVCGYGGGTFRGCKTQAEMCAHIKTNGQPLPTECGGSNTDTQANGKSNHQGASNENTNTPATNTGGTDIYGSDVCGYGGGSFRGCKTQAEMCAHIKTNGQPLPSECGGQASTTGDNTNPLPSTNAKPVTGDTGNPAAKDGAKPVVQAKPDSNPGSALPVTNFQEKGKNQVKQKQPVVNNNNPQPAANNNPQPAANNNPQPASNGGPDNLAAWNYLAPQ